ncbi:MAG: radical SAM protein [Desulfurococcales archaeon]|nr:radical SAM protein [Desulfurococcales archaeon]
MLERPAGENAWIIVKDALRYVHERRPVHGDIEARSIIVLVVSFSGGLRALDWRLARPDAISVWQDPEVRRRLSWYYSVMRGSKPARFLIARSIPVDASRGELWEMEEDSLWKLHAEAARWFMEEWLEIKDSDRVNVEKYTYSNVDTSFLDVKRVLAYRLASPCRLCERRCLVDRRRRIGACRLDINTYVHSAFLHLGEEAPLVPSGTIFYGGCNFSCVYCQNYDISQVYPRGGRRVGEEELAYIQDALARHGARNINHVGGDPTPSMHTIIGSLRYVRSNIPQLWNSNMYLSSEAMEILSHLVDIWLPDFKYGNDRCAFKLSAVPHYWKVVTRNLKHAAAHGDMIIRHLVLPGHLDCCTRPVLEFIAEELPRDRILVNIMDQYTPMHLVARHPYRWREIARRPSREEIVEARRLATELGLLWEPVS